MTVPKIQHKSIAVIGNCYFDEILLLEKFPRQDEKVLVEEIFTTLGGSAVNVACALTVLGLKASLFTVFGNDEEGQKLKQELQKRGVDFQHSKTLPERTGRTIILLTRRGISTKLGYPGACERIATSLSFEGLKDKHYSFTHIHLASVDQATIKRALDTKLPSQTISIDIGAKTVLEGKKGFLELAKQMNFVFMNREAFRLLFTESISLQTIQEVELKNIIVTAGEQGVFAKYNGSTFHQPAFPTKVNDTTGAGDLVAAVTIALLPDKKIEEVLKYATAAASIKIKSIGGSNGHPTFNEITAFLEKKNE